MDLFELVPGTEIRCWVGPFEDRRLFFEAGKHETERYIALARIEPSHDVLDLGCGCGKMAIHLAPYLREGRYTGVDSSRELLAWCQERIAPVFDNCTFQHIDVYNGAYSETGTIAPSAMRLDLPEGSVDVAIANSLFTHMLLEDIAPYLEEIRRVLRPGGMLAATWLLLNEQSRAAIARKEAIFDLVHPVGMHSLSKDAERAEEGLGHDESMVRNLHAQCGFAIQSIHLGGWARNDGNDAQDLILAERKA